MTEYKLTITVTINADDDPAARGKAKNILEAVSQSLPDADTSLKEVFKNKPPRGVKLR